jgi:hypothetical protein
MAAESYLFDCSAHPCHLWDAIKAADDSAYFLVRGPNAGPWQLLIRNAQVDGGPVALNYSIVLTDATPAFGSLPVAITQSHKAGQLQTRITNSPPCIPGSGSTGAYPAIVLDYVDAGAEAAEKATALAIFAGAPYRPAILGSAVIRLRCRGM